MFKSDALDCHPLLLLHVRSHYIRQACMHTAINAFTDHTHMQKQDRDNKLRKSKEVAAAESLRTQESLNTVNVKEKELKEQQQAEGMR